MSGSLFSPINTKFVRLSVLQSFDLKSFRQLIQYHSDLGHTYVPETRVRLRYGNDAYYIQTDSWGFRNSSKNETEPQTFILLGDSFAAGDGVSNEERFSDILEKKYACRIINLAVSGYGLDQQILAYEKFGRTIPHDGVILTPHLDDWSRNKMQSREGLDKNSGKASLIPKPYFTMEGGELRLHNQPVPLEREETESTETSHDFTLSNRAKSYLKHRILKKHLHPELSDANSDEWKLALALIQRLIEQLNGKQLWIGVFPFYDSVTYQEEPHHLKILQKLASEDVHVIDFTTPINSAYEGNPNAVFLPLCGHFTPATHQLVADTIEKQLTVHSGIALRAKTAPEVINTNAHYTLGISCFYHDSAAALLQDGKVIAAAQEERFTRIKHDKSFPDNAISYCLEQEGLSIQQLEVIVYYDYESWTIERVLHNAEALEEKGAEFWQSAKESLYMKLMLPRILRERCNYQGAIYKSQHHVSHAAGAFYPSPFEEAAILVVDGVGEWACTTIAVGEGSTLRVVAQQHYPHSLGLLYSAFTYFCGFKVNSGEYKLMGLAPYGEPKYADIIKEKLIDLHEDGSIHLHLEYFSFLEGKEMTNDRFAALFDGPARARESEITRREMDLAASIQAITEEIVIRMANHAHALTGKKNLVLSGGVALNCVSNGKLFEATPFENFYFQPASGDAGGAEGCALNWYYEHYPETPRFPAANAYLGPEFSESEILAFLHTAVLPYHRFTEGKRAEEMAEFLANKNIIGHLDGRMEFGPRALGNRSILADPTDAEMQSKLNLKIKFRESFRPFAPIYAEERTSEYFDFDKPSPYMLIVRPVADKWLIHNEEDLHANDNMIEIVNRKRSELPAITHVDNSARLQSVNPKQNKRFHDVLMEFEKRRGKAVLINTSFNVRGEPIVCTPNDAYKCFMRTNMDVLVLNDYYLLKQEQPNWKERENWEENFELD